MSDSGWTCNNCGAGITTSDKKILNMLVAAHVCTDDQFDDEIVHPSNEYPDYGR